MTSAYATDTLQMPIAKTRTAFKGKKMQVTESINTDVLAQCASTLYGVDTVLRITMLGTFSLTVGEKRLPEQFSGRNDSINLFKLLLLRRGELLKRSDIVTRLWPQVEIAQGRHRLSNALSTLRKDLQKYLDASFVAQIIFSNDNTISCPRNTHVICDVDEFESDLDLALASASDRERANALKSAIARYKGDLLEQHQVMLWFQSERELLHYRFLEALRAASECARIQRHCDVQVQYLSKLFSLAPTDEVIAVELMKAFYETSQPQEARRTYELLRRNLASASGSSPSADTENVLRALERGNSNAMQQMPSIEQAQTTRSWLQPVETLIGRDYEFGIALRAAEDPDVRAIVVCGASGVGKHTFIRHLCWHLIVRLGFTLNESSSTHSINAPRRDSGSRRAVTLLDCDNDKSVINTTSTGTDLFIISSNELEPKPRHEKSRMVLLDSMPDCAMEEVFHQHSFGVLRPAIQKSYGTLIHSEKIKDAVSRLDGHPELAKSLATHCLDQGIEPLVSISELCCDANWSRVDFVRSVYRQHLNDFNALNAAEREILDLLVATGLAVPRSCLQETVGKSQWTLAAAKSLLSLGYVQITFDSNHGELLSSTFKGECLSHVANEAQGMNGCDSGSDMLLLQEVIAADAKKHAVSADDVDDALFYFLNTNSSRIVDLVRRCASRNTASHVAWITGFTQWISRFSNDQKSALLPLAKAFEATLTLFSVNVPRERFNSHENYRRFVDRRVDAASRSTSMKVDGQIISQARKVSETV
jgi:DNA-binding SARP family transcriptional activator